MKVGIASPYFGTIGGGERYMFSAAKFFLDKGDQVDIFSGNSVDAKNVSNYFGLDLKKANFVADVFFGENSNFLRRLLVSAKYDLIFFLSDGSIPTSFAKKNWLHFQTPFRFSDKKSLINKIKLLRFQKIICNSKFTKSFIDSTYGVNSVVVYPPVDITSESQKTIKKNIILATGRFSDPKNLTQHPKKQEVLVKAFCQMVDNGLKNWELVLSGSSPDVSSYFLKSLQKDAQGYPIRFVINPKFSDLQKYYSSAKIFWHAVGFGEDISTNPGKAEHFGITTVEAMAKGAVPIVFAGGGQLEIITDGENGFLWDSLEKLQEKTLEVMSNDKLRNKISQESINRAKSFSQEVFFANLSKLYDEMV